MSSDPSYVYPVVGVHTGGILPRKEVDEFVKDKRQLLLFTRAYQILLSKPKNDTLSYFQFAGIHGSPTNQTWPVVGGPKANIPGQPGVGFYCYHFGPLFGPWHRPYVALVEQRLHDIILKLIDPKDPDYILGGIEEPEELERFKVAAETWRLPYWDFALRRANNQENNRDYCSLPDIALSDIQNFVSEGNLGSTNNPFYAYDFPGGQSGLPDYGTVKMSIQSRTVRHAPIYNPNDQATVDAWKQGKSNINSLKAFFRSETVNWRVNLIDVMSDNYSFDDFADSLNSIHGSVHVHTGGFSKLGVGNKSGNMSSIPAAGFDPIFFLWHCNVDRLCAMWEKANPDLWVDNTNNKQDLLPFRTSPTSSKKYWTAELARKFSSLGYTYPDLAEIEDPESLEVVLNRLYKDARPSRGIPRGPKSRAPHNPGSNNPGDEDENELEDEYVVTARYETHEVGAFHLDIYFKDGEHNEFITTIVNFVSPLEVDCESCRSAQEQHHTVTTSTLISPKLRELREDGKLQQLAGDNCEQALAEGLRWECYGLEGDNRNRKYTPEEFTSLQVGVSKRLDVPPGQPRSGQPRGGRPRGPSEGGRPVRDIPLRGISRGKPFGLGPDEDFRGE